ncbi:hypothetical protein EAO71_35820 [Streptomyces sp. ms191]|nr:hypothetical protein EAO71_35820 [Streptomyces sp. ms191]
MRAVRCGDLDVAEAFGDLSGQPAGGGPVRVRRGVGGWSFLVAQLASEDDGADQNRYDDQSDHEVHGSLQ